MLQVTSTLHVRHGQVDQALALAQEHVSRSRREDGCVRHEVFQSPVDPHILFFYERWRDRAALDAHFQVPASGDFVRRLTGLLREPATLQIASVSDEQSVPIA